MFTDAFDAAVNHAMLYEVGSFWQLTPEVEAGLINTRAQRKAVGYVNDPDDSGGETKFGVAKNANMDLDITNLTWDEAKGVYYNRYWQGGVCDMMPPRVAVLHFDGCVNHGIKRASKFLQIAVGAEPDGEIGPQTLEMLSSNDEFAVCEQICNLREQFYRDIVSARPSQAKFLKGWLRRINEMREFVLNQDNQF
jgi:lysozyme family protein